MSDSSMVASRLQCHIAHSPPTRVLSIEQMKVRLHWKQSRFSICKRGILISIFKGVMRVILGLCSLLYTRITQVVFKIH